MRAAGYKEQLRAFVVGLVVLVLGHPVAAAEKLDLRLPPEKDTDRKVITEKWKGAAALERAQKQNGPLKAYCEDKTGRRFGPSDPGFVKCQADQPPPQSQSMSTSPEVDARLRRPHQGLSVTE